MKAIEAAWLAGYIDGDGCICLEKSSAHSRRIRLVIDSADKELLDRVLEIVGDGSLVEKKKYSERHRQCWSWRLYGSAKVDKVLRAVLPYMRCEFKRRRAEMVVKEWPALLDTSQRATLDVRVARAKFAERFLSIGAGRGKRA